MAEKILKLIKLLCEEPKAGLAYSLEILMKGDEEEKRIMLAIMNLFKEASQLSVNSFMKRIVETDEDNVEELICGFKLFDVPTEVSDKLLTKLGFKDAKEDSNNGKGNVNEIPDDIRDLLKNF